MNRELRLLGGRYITLSTNMPLRNDGKPYAQPGRIDDAGVAVWFTDEDGQELCFPCDRWSSISENLVAITKHIEAMRGQRRWGVGTAKQAFAGYKALPANAGDGENWWEVLGVRQDASAGDIDQAFRQLARTAHPDAGGSSHAMARLNRARDLALEMRHAST